MSGEELEKAINESFELIKNYGGNGRVLRISPMAWGLLSDNAKSSLIDKVKAWDFRIEIVDLQKDLNFILHQD